MNTNTMRNIFIVGRLDCPKVTLCRYICEQLYEKQPGNFKIEFVLAFETQFDLYREDLYKENPAFLEFRESPIFYEKV
jgi:hypothetical protein